MKRMRLRSLAVMLVSLFAIASCENKFPVVFDSSPSTGQIFLYGEAHGIEKILEKELELWGDSYHSDSMRHLFVEFPHYTAEFLNIWMKSDNDDILDELYSDWAGTQSHTPVVKDFYKQIKDEYPETVFHGTDVGHQYNSTGKRYLAYLEEKGMKESYYYAASQEAIAQGKRFYRLGEDDFIYRENKMIENFAREFDKLNGENVMGIYGSAHTYLEGMTHTSNNHPCMANQLRGRYGEQIHSEDISWLVLDIDPLRVDTLVVGEKEYEALYFGEQDIKSISQDFMKREFWRLESAYYDFADRPKTGDSLPYNNYPMPVESGQVFVIDYTNADGSTVRMYYRSDGNEYEGRPTTEQFVLE